MPDSVRRLRHGVVRFARDQGIPGPTREAIAIAVSEAVTNAVLHAYIDREPGVVVVEAWLERGALIVLVCDEGRGMMPRIDSPGLGMGLSLMAQMADDLRVSDRPRRPGTRVALRFSVDGSGAAVRERR